METKRRDSRAPASGRSLQALVSQLSLPAIELPAVRITDDRGELIRWNLECVEILDVVLAYVKLSFADVTAVLPSRVVRVLL